MKKLILGLVALLTLTVTLMSCTSKEGKVKAFVEKSKEQFGVPKDLGNGTTLADITFDESTNTVTYVYEVAPEAFANVKAASEQPGYKDQIIYGQKDDASIKNLCQLIVDAKGSLVYSYREKGGTDKVDLAYDTATLQKVVDGTLPEPQVEQAQPEVSDEGATEEGTEEEATGEEGSEEEAGAEAGATEEAAE